MLQEKNVEYETCNEVIAQHVTQNGDSFPMSVGESHSSSGTCWFFSSNPLWSSVWDILPSAIPDESQVTDGFDIL